MTPAEPTLEGDEAEKTGVTLAETTLEGDEAEKREVPPQSRRPSGCRGALIPSPSRALGFLALKPKP